jgi:hypothetical protein
MSLDSLKLSLWLVDNVPLLFYPAFAVVFGILKIRLIRWVTEGDPYNYALSSEPGEMFLSGVAMIEAYIIRSEGVRGGLVTNGLWHGFLLVDCLVYAVVMKRLAKKPADIYHNSYLSPVIGYSIISLAPVVFQTNDRFLQGAAFFCAAMWGYLVIDDWRHERLDQLAYRAGIPGQLVIILPMLLSMELLPAVVTWRLVTAFM